MPDSPRRAAEPSLPDPVRLADVSFGYRNAPDVLEGVNHNLPAGSFHFLTGPSGAGKSTLLKLITLSERPRRGQLLLFGENAGGAPRDRFPHLRRRMGVVFQDFRLLDHLSAFENAALPLRLGGVRPEAYSADVREMLAWVGLGQRMNARPAELSGGEKQRLAIARAVVTQPELIIADEPTGSVDPVMGERLMGLFQSLNRLGATVLIATHDEAMARRLGGSVLRLERGRLETAA